MARPSKLDQEMGYIRDLWNEIRTIEAVHHGMVSTSVSPIKRPGIFVFHMSFTPLMGGLENEMEVCSLTFTYPNEEQSTLAGFLWRKAISLGRMVEEQTRGNGSDPTKQG